MSRVTHWENVTKTNAINTLLKQVALNSCSLLTQLVRNYNNHVSKKNSMQSSLLEHEHGSRGAPWRPGVTFSCPFLFFLLASHPLLPESFPHFLSISPNPFQGKITFSLSNAILNIISLITHIVSSHYKSVFGLHLMNHCLI